MSGRELSPQEKTAGEIVAKQLDGRLFESDVGERGSHDFDVELSDGRMVALEVTSAADEELEVLKAQAGVMEAPTLRNNWWLVVPFDGSINLRRALPKVLPQLDVLEGMEVGEVGDFVPHGTLPDAAAQAERELRQLGIRRARTWGRPSRGEMAWVACNLAGAAASNFDELNALVEKCANRKVAKLIAAGGDEAHLFIWMRSSVSDAELAMATLPPPDETPALPPGIDVVWVATVGKLWRLRPPGGWEQFTWDSR